MNSNTCLSEWEAGLKKIRDEVSLSASVQSTSIRLNEEIAKFDQKDGVTSLFAVQRLAPLMEYF